MRLRSLIAALLILPAIISCKRSGKVANGEPVKDPTGYFTFKGKPPKGFQEIDWIAINPQEPDPKAPHDANWGSDFPHGLVYFKNKKRVRFDSFSISGNDLHFKTVQSGGVSYSFDGSFGPEKAFDDVQKELSALTGKLVKQTSQGVTQVNAEFYWFNGD